jgi:nitrate reductase NapE component
VNAGTTDGSLNGAARKKEIVSYTVIHFLLFPLVLFVLFWQMQIK